MTKKLLLKVFHESFQIINFPWDLESILGIFAGTHLILKTSSDLYLFDFIDKFIRTVIPFSFEVLGE
jgi:hypothetical protein